MNTAQAALAIAERLLDPQRVAAAAPAHAIATLADGLPGTALLHARLSTIDPVFADAARAHWTAAAEKARPGAFQGAGVYGAPGGLTASLVLGSAYLPDPEIIAKTTHRSISWLSARAVEVATKYVNLVQTGSSETSWSVYDAISGLAGIGRILLAAAVDGSPSAEPGLVAALTAMTTMLTDRGRPQPGWWVPTEQHPSIAAARLDHTGAADTGLAHGVAGPLAFLSLAHSAGRTITGQLTAIRDAANWLERWRADDGGWPGHVSGSELTDGASVSSQHGRRTAWCYGTPGIVRSLIHAASALGDPVLAETALADLGRLDQAYTGWDAEGPTLCHGHAGVLRCATGIDVAVAGQAAAKVEQSIECDRPFLVAHVQHGTNHDNPGFLTGAAGVALALSELAEIPSPPVRTTWDALLLIA